MKNKTYDVLLAVFDRDNIFHSIICHIKDAYKLTNEELNWKMELEFQNWAQYIYIETTMKMGTITCKYMFIFPEDENRQWVRWKKKDGVETVAPISYKYMASLYKYTIEGEIENTYDND